jgi:hypothetical protein
LGLLTISSKKGSVDAPEISRHVDVLMQQLINKYLAAKKEPVREMSARPAKLTLRLAFLVSNLGLPPANGLSTNTKPLWY